jgi:hypothetical protein
MSSLLCLPRDQLGGGGIQGSEREEVVQEGLHGDQDELEWEMRAFQRISGELKPSEMSSKMKRAARLREERVDQEFHHATRIVDRILWASDGQSRPADLQPTVTITATWTAQMNS